MEAAVRIEIIIAAAGLPFVVSALDEAGAPGYSILRNVTGRGRHGHHDDDLIESSASVCLICICEPRLTQQITDAVIPILNRYGGLFTTADCRTSER